MINLYKSTTFKLILLLFLCVAFSVLSYADVVPRWSQVDSIRVNEGEYLVYNLADKVSGNPQLSLYHREETAWLSVSRSLLSGRAPQVSEETSYTITIRAFNNAGSSEQTFTVVVKDVSTSVRDSTTPSALCPVDVRVCPDGSKVFRSGEFCEFAPCPLPLPIHNGVPVLGDDCHIAKSQCNTCRRQGDFVQCTEAYCEDEQFFCASFSSDVDVPSLPVLVLTFDRFERHLLVLQAQQLLNKTSCKVATSGPGSPGSETDYFGPATDRALLCDKSARNTDYSGTITQSLVDGLQRYVDSLPPSTTPPAPKNPPADDNPPAPPNPPADDDPPESCVNPQPNPPQVRSVLGGCVVSPSDADSDEYHYEYAPSISSNNYFLITSSVHLPLLYERNGVWQSDPYLFFGDVLRPTSDIDIDVRRKHKTQCANWSQPVNVNCEICGRDYGDCPNPPAPKNPPADDNPPAPPNPPADDDPPESCVNPQPNPPQVRSVLGGCVVSPSDADSDEYHYEYAPSISRNNYFLITSSVHLPLLYERNGVWQSDPYLFFGDVLRPTSDIDIDVRRKHKTQCANWSQPVNVNCEICGRDYGDCPNPPAPQNPPADDDPPESCVNPQPNPPQVRSVLGGCVVSPSDADSDEYHYEYAPSSLYNDFFASSTPLLHKRIGVWQSDPHLFFGDVLNPGSDIDIDVRRKHKTQCANWSQSVIVNCEICGRGDADCPVLCSDTPPSPPPVPTVTVRVKPYSSIRYTPNDPWLVLATHALPGSVLTKDINGRLNPDLSEYEYQHKLSADSDCSTDAPIQAARYSHPSVDAPPSGWRFFHHSRDIISPYDIKHMYPDGYPRAKVHYYTDSTVDNYKTYYACLRRRVNGCTDWSDPVSASPATVARCHPDGRLASESSVSPKLPSRPCEFGIYNDDYKVNSFSHQWSCRGYGLDDLTDPQYKGYPYVVQCKQCKGGTRDSSVSGSESSGYMQITPGGVICADCVQWGEVCSDSDEIFYTYKCTDEDGKPFEYTSPFSSGTCPFGCTETTDERGAPHAECNRDPDGPLPPGSLSCSGGGGTECRADGNVWANFPNAGYTACEWQISWNCEGRGCYESRSYSRVKKHRCNPDPCNQACSDSVRYDGSNPVHSCETKECKNKPGVYYNTGGCKTTCDPSRSCGAAGRGWSAVCQ